MRDGGGIKRGVLKTFGKNITNWAYCGYSSIVLLWSSLKAFRIGLGAASTSSTK